MFKQLLFIVILGFFAATDTQANTQVISHPALNNKQISALMLQRIYAMQVKNWADGTPVKVFVLPTKKSMHREFIVEHFAMAPHKFDRLWKRLLFSGTGRGPQQVENQTEMIAKVSSTPGAIGYIAQPSDQSLQTVQTVEVIHE